MVVTKIAAAGVQVRTMSAQLKALGYVCCLEKRKKKNWGGEQGRKNKS